MIKIYEPYKISNFSQKAFDLISQGKLTSQNEEFNLLTHELTKLHGKKTVPVFNGTCATHLAFKTLKEKLPNLKNIIIPNNVYVAAWNCMLMDGDINLIPVDADENTWCVNIEKLRIEIAKHDPFDTGILIVHNVGNVINVPKLIREFPTYSFIEDNCEGFLGEYENQKSGTASLASSISFYANKTITCGEGGAVIVSDKYHEKINKIQSQGQTKERYVHDVLAYNYRMTNLQAGMLLDQLSILDEIKSKKEYIFKRYERDLSSKIKLQKAEENTKHSHWMCAVRINNFNYHKENSVFSKIFETRPMFYPLSAHSHLRHFSRDETVAHKLSKECFMLPSHPNLTDDDLDIIINNLNKYFS